MPPWSRSEEEKLLLLSAFTLQLISQHTPNTGPDLSPFLRPSTCLILFSHMWKHLSLSVSDPSSVHSLLFLLIKLPLFLLSSPPRRHTSNLSASIFNNGAFHKTWLPPPLHTLLFCLFLWLILCSLLALSDYFWTLLSASQLWSTHWCLGGWTTVFTAVSDLQPPALCFDFNTIQRESLYFLLQYMFLTAAVKS